MARLKSLDRLRVIYHNTVASAQAAKSNKYRVFTCAMGSATSSNGFAPAAVSSLATHVTSKIGLAICSHVIPLSFDRVPLTMSLRGKAVFGCTSLTMRDQLFGIQK